MLYIVLLCGQTAKQALMLWVLANVLMLMCGSNYVSYFGLEWITQMEIITTELSESDGKLAFYGDVFSS